MNDKQKKPALLFAEEGRGANDILYICDRKKCENCNNECHLTRDIAHAVMFYKDETGAYIERITIPRIIHDEAALQKILIEEMEATE